MNDKTAYKNQRPIDNRPGFWVDFMKEVLRSGTIAALAMIPFGLLFFALGYRINEYGLTVIQTFFQDLPVGIRFGLFVGEHFLISWGAAVPLLLLLGRQTRFPGWLVGAGYGAGFYVAINSLVLPFLFGDPTPWQLGFEVVFPSLVVHLIYGIAVTRSSRMYLMRHTER